MLSLRLMSLTKYVDYNDNLIDIGCDHALLDIYLVKNNIVKKMIASDIHSGALNQGKKNVTYHKLEDKIDLRLGDGLSVLNKKDKVDTILISGMGANTIISILDNLYFDNINKLIIESNNDHALLRDILVKKGFMITAEEYLVDNDKSYINIVFKRGIKKYTKKEILYGPFLIHNQTYLGFRLREAVKIYNLIPKNKIKTRLKMKREINFLNKLMIKNK